MKYRDGAPGQCQGCSKKWASLESCHCRTCHVTYRSEATFIAHRKKCGQAADCTCRKAACRKIQEGEN